MTPCFEWLKILLHIILITLSVKIFKAYVVKFAKKSIAPCLSTVYRTLILLINDEQGGKNTLSDLIIIYHLI